MFFRKLLRLISPQLQEQKDGAGRADRQRRALQHGKGGKSRGRRDDRRSQHDDAGRLGSARGVTPKI
jgi:hypothetical protein